MALVLKDRVKEQTTTTGTGSVTLGGAVSGFETFSAVGDGNTTYYAIVHQTADEWEVGLGTYTAAGTLLSRDTILESSNSDAAVVFSAGTKDVFVTYPSDKAVYADAAGEVSVTRATSATFATSATEAATAIFATSATNATFAVSATRSTSATFAVSASLAAFAASATNATTAVSATNATSATFATSATNATTAINVSGFGIGGGVLLNSGVSVSSILDEDNMASNSATALSTQQSIKAYVDAQVGTADTLSEVLALGNTTGGTDIAMTGGDKITNFESTGINDDAASTAITIDSSGNVGIGTTSPSTKLDITGSGAYSNRIIHIAGDINPTGYDSGTSGARIGFTYGATPVEVAGIRSGVTNGGAGSETAQLVFSTANSGTLSEKMRITSSGNVGIGTTSPDFLLDVAGRIGILEGTNGIAFHDGAGSVSAGVRADSGDNLVFATGSSDTERMRLDSSGNVAVGRTSSVGGAKVTVETGASTPAVLGYGDRTWLNAYDPNSGGTPVDLRLWAYGNSNATNDAYVGTWSAHPLKFATGGSIRATIDTSGNVGIGTTSPDGKLNVQRTAASAGWIINGQTVGVANDSGLYMDASNNIELAVRDGSGTFTGAVRSSGVTFFNGGNVGIGTSSPGAELDIESTSPEIHLNDSDGVLGAAVTSRMIFQANGSSQGRVGFGTTAGNMALTNLQGNLFIQADTNNAQANSYITFSVDNSSKMRITSAGNVGIGTTAPAKQLHITKSAKADIGTLTDGATITPNFDANQNFSVTLGGNRTLANPSNIDPGQTGSIFVVQDGTGGRTLSFGSYWKFAGGTAPTLSTGTSATDRIDYVVQTSTAIHAVASLNLS